MKYKTNILYNINMNYTLNSFCMSFVCIVYLYVNINMLYIIY